MIRFPIGNSGQYLIFTKEVLTHLESHRQLRFWQSETGGLLFARLIDCDVVVEVATGPRKTDRRTRWTYRPDRFAEQQEIDDLHPQGLLFVGTWHSHPEPVPTPSSVDLHSLAESFLMSQHHLNAFVLAIIGQRPVPKGLRVVLGDGYHVVPLENEDVGATNEAQIMEQSFVKFVYSESNPDHSMDLGCRTV